ncbi:hypothetical protein AZE42_12869 [Rhizopogon vesiculosus]|uniref:Uncharacterized protein n=1 Tax=Rhizopogon vesiculosus TaxID=180088 RepID=A0A1J8QMB1_9AGAM|nr:hypothetical protein AZE42_12869 [Rhizopogon vesiculosus]
MPTGMDSVFISTDNKFEIRKGLDARQAAFAVKKYKSQTDWGNGQSPRMRVRRQCPTSINSPSLQGHYDDNRSSKSAAHERMHLSVPIRGLSGGVSVLWETTLKGPVILVVYLVTVLIINSYSLSSHQDARVLLDLVPHQDARAPLDLVIRQDTSVSPGPPTFVPIFWYFILEGIVCVSCSLSSSP